MELWHLRYFVAVVEEGSLTTAAELRFHTSQPSLSRQIRDLEYHRLGAGVVAWQANRCSSTAVMEKLPAASTPTLRARAAVSIAA
jgi:LysR family hca operon transcriptional activator